MSEKLQINIKNEIKEYLKYDDYISTYESKIRKIKTLRKTKANTILKFFKNSNINKDIKAGNSILQLKKTNTKTTLSQKFLKESMTNYFITYHKNLKKDKCIELSGNILEFINNSRETKQKISLKRIIT